MAVTLQIVCYLILAICVWAIGVTVFWFYPAHRDFIAAENAMTLALLHGDPGAIDDARFRLVAALERERIALLWALNPFAWVRYWRERR